MAEAEVAAPTDEPVKVKANKKEKKPKLSKQEKKRLKLLAALELKKKLFRDQLTREIALCNKSLKRGKLEWEGMCREIKLQEFRDEVEIWAEKAERSLKKKDEKIEALINTLEETQELHGRSFSKHLEQLDYLTKCHQIFRGTATALYESQASEMIQDFLWHLDDTHEVQARYNMNNENIMHTTNIVIKDRLMKTHDNYLEMRYDEVCGEVEKRYILRDETACKMRKLQNQLLRWTKILEGDIVDVNKTKRYLWFMKRQRNYVRESNRLNNVEKICQQKVMELQKELLFIEATCTRNLYGLQLERNYFLEARSLLKNSIAQNKQSTFEKMIGFASASYRVINKLEDIVKNGELLLNVGVCCRKYQTQKEKVLPLNNEPDDCAYDSDFKLKIEFDIFKYLDISEEELEDQMDIVKHFWRRCSNVKYHNILLTEEKRKLNEENEKYQNIIRSLKKSDDVEYILESLKIKQLLT